MTETWVVTIYRRDSETPVKYEGVKHFWLEESSRLVIAVYETVGKPEHFYWIWPVDLISHVKAQKAASEEGGNARR